MRKNQLYIPINLERIIEPQESVRILDEICEELDYTELRRSYQRKSKGNSACPETMFKILVYGYMTGHRSSREIEETYIQRKNRPINLNTFFREYKGKDRY